MRTKMISWLHRTRPDLNHLWRGPWTARRLEPARYLYDNELVLVLEGTCRVEIESRVFELATGDWIIVPSATNHSSIGGLSGTFRACLHFDWLPFTGKRPAAVFSFYPDRPKKSALADIPRFIPKGILHGRFVIDGPVPGLLETIFHLWRNADELSQQLARIHFHELLIHLFISPADIPKKEEASSRIAYAAREILEGDLIARDGIQRQLEGLGFSYAHVCRVFHKTFGLTPARYRNAVRLERAKTLLSNPRLTVAQVAYESGFDDPTYFTRLFRRQNKLPPSAFRELE